MNALDTEKLKALPRNNPTSLLVLQELSKRERNRHETDIDRNAMTLLFKGFKVNPEHYKQFWKELETLGAGIIVYGRNGNSDRFQWHYSLKDVGQAAISDTPPAALEPLSEASKAPKRQYKKRSKRGRPAGSKNRPKAVFNIPTSPSTSGIILTIKDVDGKTHSISLEEAVKISNQVSKLKALAQAA